MSSDDLPVVTIRDILNSIERYNPSHLPILESFVEDQAHGLNCDLEANLAVLKLYQFNKTKIRIDITASILLLALTNMPKMDFAMAKCLLMPGQMEDEDIGIILELGDLLERSEFKTFWQKAKSHKELYTHIKGFEESIRNFICYIIDTAFQTISKTLLKQFLSVDNDDGLKPWMKRYGWTQQDDEFILVSLQDGKIQTKSIDEKIDLQSLANVMIQSM